MSTPFLIRSVLDELDWTEFTNRYSLKGRSPYHPAAILGLIMLGIVHGVTSLRRMEHLANDSASAYWVSGGICPDHSTIGNFIIKHSESLTDKFFVDLTTVIVTRLGSKMDEIAIDGTIIEAVASRVKTIKIEAANQAAEKAKKAAESSPNDPDLQKRAEKAAVVAEAAEVRAEKRVNNGDKRSETQVCTTEPEAPILKGKKGNYTPAYVGSVAANADKIVVAQHVEPTDEQASFGPLLDQAKKVGVVKQVTADGNYAKEQVLKRAVEEDIDILCNPPKLKKSKPNKKFTKADFRYHETENVYICPGGQKLGLKGTQFNRRGKTYSRYISHKTTCQTCPFAGRCLSEKQQRKVIERYSSEEWLEAQRMVMGQKGARAALKKRGEMVEPVFSELRGIQGLNRFRRHGLAAVRLEFALHACAHNIRRLIALVARQRRTAKAAPFGLLYVLFRAILGSLEPRTRIQIICPTI